MIINILIDDILIRNVRLRKIIKNDDVLIYKNRTFIAFFNTKIHNLKYQFKVDDIKTYKLIRRR